MNRLEITSLEEQYNIEKEKYREELNKQRKSKRQAAFYLGIVIAIFAIVALPIILLQTCGVRSCSSCNSKNYSLDNISISVTKKENDIEKSIYINGRTVGIYFNVTNSSKVLLSEIRGEMKVYLGEDNYLMTWNVNLSDSNGIGFGQSKEMIIKCDANSSDKMDKFYNASLEDLKLTFIISYAYFGTTVSDIQKVENSSSEERVIKPYIAKEVQAVINRKYQIELQGGAI